ncbi:MAG: hypothetical protein AAB407_02825 [Patescibacteria group bacterium]
MQNKLFLFGIIAVAVLGGILLLSRSGSDAGSNSSANNLYPEQSISHGHGLTVDIADPNKLYIATHHGLLVLMNEKDLYRVGTSKDDYMGFSLHPSEANIFFSSGHPARGGNLGVQKSEDGGLTWEKISNGVNGPVDFHEMAISPINPQLMYGYFEGTLQRSIDGGNAWEIVETTNLPQPIGFIFDPKDEKKLYALTIYGTSLSTDQGETWENVFPELYQGITTTFAINPSDPLKMIGFSRKKGILVTEDGGSIWRSIVIESFSTDFPIYITYAPRDPMVVYALTKENKLYTSSDAGNTWTQIY